MKKCLIIANGKSPSKSTVRYLVGKGFSVIICADGGANSAKNIGIIPDFIIGDFDSVESSTLKYFLHKSKLIQYKRQTDTDVEKCLKFIIKKGFKEVVLLGVTGNRLDHTIGNLGIVLKYFKNIKIHIAAEKSFLTPYNKFTILRSNAGETISLYAFDKKTSITSKGLKYPLKNSKLPFGLNESTSNAATDNIVELKINGGIVFVIRDFNFVKKYDLI